MAEARSTKTAKACVAEVLNPHMTAEVWTANYTPALPFTLQDFSIGALLPAMMYMFRWGHRRGKGSFAERFDRNGDGKATIEEVATTIVSERPAEFAGWSGEAAQAILGDLLLGTCLENKGHKTGRREPLIRAYPAHYMASWIDLPKSISHLRFVPEMLVRLLSCHRQSGNGTGRPEDTSRFQLGVGPDRNLLLSLFGRGVVMGERLRDMAADKYDEQQAVGVDQLLMIRMAQICGSAPQKMSERSEQASISDQLPVAKRATIQFYEDLRVFLVAYGASIPRRSLLPMLESAIGLGLTNLLLSTTMMLSEWERSGHLPEADHQVPWPLFVDCSGSTDLELRRLSEEATEETIRRFVRLPAILMCLRVVGARVRVNRKMAEERLPSIQPDATGWINLLGDIVNGRHKHADHILDKLHEDCASLSEALQKEDQNPEAISLLTDDPGRNPAWRLSEALTLLMGHKNQAANHAKCLDACLLLNEYNGLAKSRRVRLRNPTAGSFKTAEVRSIVLTNTALDLLVHRHLRKGGQADGRVPRSLSLGNFVDRLRQRYGLHIDEAPPGLAAPRELLLRNRQTFERRLRDLGVLVGVNDAESMKRLRQRFAAAGDDFK